MRGGFRADTKLVPARFYNNRPSSGIKVNIENAGAAYVILANEEKCFVQKIQTDMYGE